MPCVCEIKWSLNTLPTQTILLSTLLYLYLSGKIGKYITIAVHSSSIAVHSSCLRCLSISKDLSHSSCFLLMIFSLISPLRLTYICSSYLDQSMLFSISISLIITYFLLSFHALTYPSSSVSWSIYGRNLVVCNSRQISFRMETVFFFFFFSLYYLKGFKDTSTRSGLSTTCEFCQWAQGNMNLMSDNL